MPLVKKSWIDQNESRNRQEQGRESSREKSRIVQNEFRELTKKSRIVLGANLSSRELSDT